MTSPRWAGDVQDIDQALEMRGVNPQELLRQLLGFHEGETIVYMFFFEHMGIQLIDDSTLQYEIWSFTTKVVY